MNERIRTALLNTGLLLLRLVFGLLISIQHGLPKLMSFESMSRKFADPFGIGMKWSLVLSIFGELICGLAIVFGLFTRLALIPLIINMSVALFLVHAKDPLATKEPALVYLAVFVSLLLTGAGRYSLDALVLPKLRKSGGRR